MRMDSTKEKRIIKTKRDRELINFLEKGAMATAEQLNLLFFNSPVSCRRRLVRMYEMGWIDRVRADESLPYVYLKKGKEEKITHKEKAELSLEEETRQNKKLYLTQCLTELTKLEAEIVRVEFNKTLTTTVADMFVLLKYRDHNIVFVIDVFNRDGNGLRHQTFFNESRLLNEIIEKDKAESVMGIVYAERIREKQQHILFIQRPATLSYRDYKKIDWTKEMDSLNRSIKYAFDPK